jgi:hypothetical protein
MFTPSHSTIEYIFVKARSQLTPVRLIVPVFLTHSKNIITINTQSYARQSLPGFRYSCPKPFDWKRNTWVKNSTFPVLRFGPLKKIILSLQGIKVALQRAYSTEQVILKSKKQNEYFIMVLIPYITA